MSVSIPASTSASKTSPNHDFLTVAAISVAVYALKALIHEGLGHALPAALLGAEVQKLTNAYVLFDESGLSLAALRLIAVGGVIANFIFGLLALAWLARFPPAKPGGKFFLWLLGHGNLWGGAGYLLALSFAGIGDMNALLQGIEPKLPYQLGLTLVGLLITIWTFFRAARSLNMFTGRQADRRKRGFLLTLTPFLLGGLSNIAATAVGMGSLTAIFFSSAGSTFGGMWMMIWTPFALGPVKNETPENPVTVGRDWRWVAAGAAALLFNLLWFGPGLVR